MNENEEKVYKVLNNLGIKYDIYEHEAVYTVDQAQKLNISMPGKHCKNLFLRNRKGKIHYLLILDESKKADLKSLQKQIKSTSLSFASEERLYKYLLLKPGSVTPFGIINDYNKSVQILIDKDLLGCDKIYFHPNVNTKTIGISYNDFEKFIKWHGNEFVYVNID